MAVASATIDMKTGLAARRFLERVGTQYDVAGARLFGSRARGDHREASDADVAVLLEGPIGDFTRVSLAMADIAYDVMLETGVLIQPLPIWLEEWRRPESYPNPRLLLSIAREGLAL